MPADLPSERNPRPLVGRRVMVTRPAGSPDPLVDQLRQLGAEVIVQPAVRIGPPADWRPVDDALERLAQFDWLVFSSVNGVRYLLDRLLEHGGPQRLAALKLAAIGPGTAAELARYHLHADLVPTQFRAEALAQELSRDAAGRRFLLRVPAAAARSWPTNSTPPAPSSNKSSFIPAPMWNSRNPRLRRRSPAAGSTG